VPTALTERQEEFVREARIGRLITIGRDGAPHVAPIWYVYDEGTFLILTDETSLKVRNIKRDPRVVLCIDDERPPYHYVIARGEAVLAPPLGEAWRLALAVRYLGTEIGRRYVESTGADNEILIRLAPTSYSTR
jgi:PPOX class probable F420-dependent enzyme